jgi:hypothetical protein
MTTTSTRRSTSCATGSHENTPRTNGNWTDRIDRCNGSIERSVGGVYLDAVTSCGCDCHRPNPDLDDYHYGLGD